MHILTIEEFCALLEAMTIENSYDSGFAIAHFGHIVGRPTIAISNCRGTGEFLGIQ